MADQDFQVEAIGEVYAQALVNEAQKQNALAEVTEDVRGLGTLLKTNKAFLAFTQSLSIGEEERIGALDKIFQGRVHKLTLATIKSLARRDRLMFLNGFVTGFETILKKMGGQVDVELVSSSDLSPAIVERVKQAVSRNVGKDAVIRTKVDPSLIGGMTLRIGDTLIDGSVATQLNKIEEQLKSKGLSGLKMESAVS